MASSKLLTVSLKLIALYAGILGSLALFFHEAAAFIFQYEILDPITTRYWGGSLLAMAIFYLFLSMDPEKYRLFIWVGVFELGISMAITIMNIAKGLIGFNQGAVGVILNPIFIVVLLYGLAKEPEGMVVLIAGEEKTTNAEEQLPAHVTGKHPLQGK